MPGKKSFKRLALMIFAAALLSAGFQQRESQGAADDSLNPYALSKERFVLPNGLAVVVVEKHKLPLVQVQLMIRTGSFYEPEEKAGLANLTAMLLDKGSSRKTALEVAESLDMLGASFSVSPGKSGSSMNLSVLLRDVEEGLSLFTEILMDPTFRDDELERIKKTVLSEIVHKRDQPRSMVHEAILDMIYEGHAMRRPVEGYEHTVAGITAEDIREFYRRNYRPGKGILAIVADMSTWEMKSIVNRFFINWTGAAAQGSWLATPGEDIGKRVRLVDMDVNQSYVQLGMLTLKRSDPDYTALKVMNYIMGGGGFVSRLLKRIRSEEGLAYSVYSYPVPGSIFSGYYIFGLQTKIATTSRAINLMLEIMQGMMNDLVTHQELEETKSFYEGSMVRRMETYSDVSRLVMDQEFYGLPEQYFLKDLEEIKKMSREDVQRVARKYIKMDNFNIAIVTNVQQLELDIQGIEKDMIKEVE